MAVELDGQPYVVVDYERNKMQKPGAGYAHQAP